jgi:hypothetical protein
MPETIFKDGVACPKFDHTKESIIEACGYTYEEAKALAKKHNDLVGTLDWEKGVSGYIEMVHLNFTSLEITLLNRIGSRSRLSLIKELMEDR